MKNKSTKDYEAIREIWEVHRESPEWLSPKWLTHLIEIYIRARDRGESPASALKIQEIAYFIAKDITTDADVS